MTWSYILNIVRGQYTIKKQMVMDAPFGTRFWSIWSYSSYSSTVAIAAMEVFALQVRTLGRRPNAAVHEKETCAVSAGSLGYVYGSRLLTFLTPKLG